MKRHRGLGVLIAASLAVFCPMAFAQPSDGVSVSVTPEAGRAMARQALQIGNPGLAVRIASQLVTADPTDVGAMMLLTAGLTRTGHAAQAVQSGRKAFRLSTTPAERFEAAYLTAAALSAADRPQAAKLWLRRADNSSDKSEERDLLSNAFRQLDARTPLTLQLSFGGGPTDNVNGGSLHDSFDFFGIPLPIAQALPGTTLTSAAQLSYRIVARPKVAASLYAIGLQRNVWLSPRAYDLMPGARNSDYLYDSIDIGGSVAWVASAKASFNLDLRIGETWQGGTRQSDHQRLVFGMTRALSDTVFAHLDLTADQTHYPTSPNANALRLAAESSLSLPLGPGKLRYSLGVAQVNSKAAGVAYRAVTTGAEWGPAQDFHGVKLSVFGRVEVRNYWRTPQLDPDVLTQAGITAQFSKLSTYGFSPSLTLSASRSISQVVVRDTANVGLTIGINSAF
ncbi:MAG: tetratricopeptide repeat protein [Cypionkella sp.]